jgi:hypothetical protein
MIIRASCRTWKIRNHSSLREKTKIRCINQSQVPCSSLGENGGQPRKISFKNPISEGGRPQNSLLLWYSKAAFISGFQHLHRMAKPNKVLGCQGEIRQARMPGKESTIDMASERKTNSGLAPRGKPLLEMSLSGTQRIRGPAFSPYSITT